MTTLYHSRNALVNGANDRHLTDGRLLIFHLSRRTCAVPLDRVQEILPMARLSRPPGLPSILEGFLNLAGSAVGVLRLDRLLNLEEREPGLYSALLVFRAKGNPVAWLVDDVCEIVPVSSAERMPLSADHSFNGCADAEVSVDGQIIHVLSPDRVLLEREKQSVAQFQKLEQDRLANLPNVMAS